MTESAIEDELEAGQAGEDALPRFEAPIVPTATIASRALVAVIAIMTFLSSLTTGAVMMVRGAASDWQAEVAREVTIQVRPIPGRDIEADVRQAADAARGLSGIAEIRPYTKDESAQLLEPWLGSGLRLGDLPIPRIIAVRLETGATTDFGQLRARLAGIPGATLDDHRSFVDRMRAMSGTAVLVGIAVLGLMLVATVLSVTFATRAAMATNRPVVEVLHFIGAKTNYIAGHFQRQFLLLGLKGGLIGGGGALVLFGLGELANRRFFGAAASAQFSALFGVLSIGIAGYVAVVVQVLLIALLTAISSRFAVNRTLEAIQ